MKITKFEDIQAWQAARELTKRIYTTTNSKSFHKDYGLKDQIQGSSVSIMANIAEGFDRSSNKEFIQFLFYAIASASEVKSHLYVALDLSYISKEEFQSLYNQLATISKLIRGFIKYLTNN